MLITIDIVLAAIVAAAPALTAIIGIIAAIVKLMRNNKATTTDIMNKVDALEKSVLDMKEYETLKAQLRIVYDENVALKHQINELLTAIDKVARE